MGSGQHIAVTRRVDEYNLRHPNKRPFYVNQGSLFIISQTDATSEPTIIPLNTAQCQSIHNALGLQLGFKMKIFTTDPDKKVTDSDCLAYYKKVGIKGSYHAACLRDMHNESILMNKKEVQQYKK